MKASLVCLNLSLKLFSFYNYFVFIFLSLRVCEPWVKVRGQLAASCSLVTFRIKESNSEMSTLQNILGSASMSF